MRGGHQKHSYAGPLWYTWDTVTIGLGGTTTPVNGPNTEVEFCYVANMDAEVGFVRVMTKTPGDDTPSVVSGPKAPEVGLYYPAMNLKSFWFGGETGNETVTLNIALPKQ